MQHLMLFNAMHAFELRELPDSLCMAKTAAVVLGKLL
jgi:hypothetical protein